MKVLEEVDQKQQEYITDGQAMWLVVGFLWAVLAIVGLPALLL